MSKLSDREIGDKLKGAPGWKRSGEAVQRSFEFDDFAQAMAFVNKAAALSEKHDHHPDIDIRWNRVILTLSTHNAGGLTEKDFAMARGINELV